MSEHPETLSRAGWYPDPQNPGFIRWFDGFQWQIRMPVEQRPAVGRGFRALGIAVVALLGVSVVPLVGSAVIQVWGLTSLPDDLRRGRTGLANRYDQIDSGSALVFFVALLATCVVWCVWQFRLARSADAEDLRRSPGLHVGSWFIPVVSLWFPVQNMRDLWRFYLPERGTALLGWWWAAFLIGGVATRVQSAQGEGLTDLQGFQDYNLVGLVGSIAWLAAAGLAIRMVLALTRGALAYEQAEREKGTLAPR